MEKQIRITCDPKNLLPRLPLDQLNPIQGKLKEMTAENFQKLRGWILADGFNFPFFVWKELTPCHSKSEAKRLAAQKEGLVYSDDSVVAVVKWWIVDGHGRKHVLTHLRDEEGYSLPDFPVVEIEAVSYEEAKRKVLNVSSSFNSMTHDGLYEFMMETGLGMLDLEKFSLAEVDVPEFKMEFFEEEKPPGDPAEEEGEKTDVSFEAYKNSAIKQVTLYYPKENYELIVKALEQLATRFGVEDFSQVVWRLVSEAVQPNEK